MIQKIIFSLTELVLAGAGLLTHVSHAAITVTIEQQGSDVVASYSGSIDLTGIVFNTAGSANSNRIGAQGGLVNFQNGEATKFSMVDFPPWNPGNPWTVAPTAFGTGGTFDADTVSIASGNAFGFQSNAFYIEPEYVSGSTISGSMTFENQTLASMGIDVGSMTATFSSGDTLTVTAVPEPTSAFLAGLCALGLIALRRRRQQLSLE